MGEAKVNEEPRYEESSLKAQEECDGSKIQKRSRMQMGRIVS